MTTPREIIETRLPVPPYGISHRATWAEAIIEALTAGGYSIVKTEELERVRDDALEEAAEFSENYHFEHHPEWERTATKRDFANGTRERIAACLRAMKGAKP